MKPPENFPNLPVEEGARRLALGHLDEATVARARLAHRADPESLHDYRVALRRLRSCLRAYRKPLRSSVTGKSRRRLRSLTRGTNRARDLEVHLAWLTEQGHAAAESDRPGVAWVISRLAAAKEEARDEVVELDARLFPGIRVRLTSQLTRYLTTIDLARSFRRGSTAAVTARLVRATSRRLQARLDRIHDYLNDDAVHRARIAAKHLRYLLEPFADALPEVGTAVERLKALQDGFGDVHDAQTFEAELRSMLADASRASAARVAIVPGIGALLAQLEVRGRRAFDRTAAQWMGKRSEGFFQATARLADAIASLVDRDREVERKFLLTGLPCLDSAGPPVEIEQGYLPGQRVIERIRRMTSADGVELVRTVKSGTGLTRTEIEEPVAPELFERLWPLTEGRRLRKRRYRVPDGDLTWEIDEFLDRDLVLAEVELTGRPLTVELPAWLRPCVDRDVTEEEDFSNLRLASRA